MKHFNQRAQLRGNQVDTESTPYGDFKWLCNYQDHLTKFIHLISLKLKWVAEVSGKLLKIVSEFGVSSIMVVPIIHKAKEAFTSPI